MFNTLPSSLPSQNATFALYVGGSEITSVAYDTAISGGDWDGWKFTSTINGNTIFLPANGYLSGEDTHFFGEIGGYWSSSLDVEHPGYAWYLCFKRNTQEQHIYSQNRYYGLMVRAVRQK